jgi:hypothetical protein
VKRAGARRRRVARAVSLGWFPPEGALLRLLGERDLCMACMRPLVEPVVARWEPVPVPRVAALMMQALHEVCADELKARGVGFTESVYPAGEVH